MLIRSLAIAAALFAGGLASARAESLWIAGGSFAGSARVAYGTLVLPLPGRKLSDGWSQSVSADAVTYEYLQGDVPTDGFSRSLKYAISRQFQTERGSIGVGLGIAARRTTLTPEDPGSRGQGDQVRGVVEAQWQSTFDRPWRTQAFSQYVVGARSNFAVGFVGRRTARGVYVGPQVSTSGDPSYRVYGLAASAAGWKWRGLDIGGYVGAQHQERGETKGEIGFTVVVYRP